MNTKIKLNIEDRYKIITYAHQIPSSTGVFFNFHAFVEKLELSDEEEKKYDIRIGEDGSIISNDPEYTVEYDTAEFPEIIMQAIKLYIEDLNKQMADLREANKENPDYTDSELYLNIVKYLGKLF